MSECYSFPVHLECMSIPVLVSVKRQCHKSMYLHDDTARVGNSLINMPRALLLVECLISTRSQHFHFLQSYVWLNMFIPY